ncbi:MAG: hypothetical protein ACTHYF_04145 [Ruoffia tabacinasalis]|uniref:hypothetical protein n=1 Tax=Lactobacillales TaxID=186826 RepID=UPI000ECF66B0|nr:hypothetical protein [Aerococcaceae bacterium]
MNQNDTFKAIIKVHELNDVLVDNDVDEKDGEEVEKVIFQIVEVIEGNYEYDEDVNQIHIESKRIIELLGEPVDETKQYEALLSNEYDAERDTYNLYVHELKVI